MTDLKTTYMGIPLNNPLMVFPSPLTEGLDNIRRMEDAGAGAVVMHSLFEEQIRLEELGLDRNLNQGTESYWESPSYFPDIQDFHMGPEEYLREIGDAKKALAIPVLGSLNGVSLGGWIRYAKAIEQAGADGLELNVYSIPTDPEMDSLKVEQNLLNLVREVKKNLRIPVAVKIGPFFSSLPNVAKKLSENGADALVLFNRFYQPDLDLESLEVCPNITLSDSNTIRLRLRWVAILFGRIQADMAITGGVQTAEDAVKAVMVGAKAAMMTSALLKHGIPTLSSVLDGFKEWMEKHDYESIRQMHGALSQKSVADPAAFERVNYMKVLGSYR
jgi:dihydroorotate dehydrogenase (fumarate)